MNKAYFQDYYQNHKATMNRQRMINRYKKRGIPVDFIDYFREHKKLLSKLNKLNNIPNDVLHFFIHRYKH